MIRQMLHAARLEPRLTIALIAALPFIALAAAVKG